MVIQQTEPDLGPSAPSNRGAPTVLFVANDRCLRYYDLSCCALLITVLVRPNWALGLHQLNPAEPINNVIIHHT